MAASANPALAAYRAGGGASSAPINGPGGSGGPVSSALAAYRTSVPNAHPAQPLNYRMAHWQDMYKSATPDVQSTLQQHIEARYKANPKDPNAQAQYQALTAANQDMLKSGAKANINPDSSYAGQVGAVAHGAEKGIGAVGSAVVEQALGGLVNKAKPGQEEAMAAAPNATAAKNLPNKKYNQFTDTAQLKHDAATAITDRLFLGEAGPIVQAARNIFIGKMGVDQVKQLPGVIKTLQDPNTSQEQKAQVIAQTLTGAGLTAVALHGLASEGVGAVKDQVAGIQNVDTIGKLGAMNKAIDANSLPASSTPEPLGLPAPGEVSVKGLPSGGVTTPSVIAGTPPRPGGIAGDIALEPGTGKEAGSATTIPLSKQGGQTISAGPETKPLSATEAKIAAIDQKLNDFKTGKATDITPEQAKQLQLQRNGLTALDHIATDHATQYGTTVDQAHAQLGAGHGINSPIYDTVSRGVFSDSGIGNTADRTPYTAAVADTLDKVKPIDPKTSNFGKAASEIKNLFSITPDEASKQVRNDLRSSMGELSSAAGKNMIDNADSRKFFDRQSPGDNLNFIQRIESGVSQPNVELQQHANFFHNWFNQDYQMAENLKPDLPYVENYFARSGFWDNPKAAQAFLDKWMQSSDRSLGGNPTALNQREFPTIYDGIKAGLRPKETNPMVIALNNRYQLLRATMAQDFMDKQLAKGASPAVTQELVNRVLDPGLQGSAIFKSSREAAYALNNLQLGLSGFHFTGTAINSALSHLGNSVVNLTSGHPVEAAKNLLTTPLAPVVDQLGGSALRKAAVAGDASNKYIQLAKQANFDLLPQVDYQTTGLSKSLSDIQSGTIGGIAKGVALSPFRALSTLAKPLMEVWVPNMKAGAFKNLMDTELLRLGKDATPEAVQAAAQRVGDSVDNRFGKLNTDNLFWDAKLRDLNKVFFRSPGWNIGTVREVGGGVADLLKPSTYRDLASGHGVSQRTAYAGSLGLGVAMLGGTMQYMMTGHWPTGAKDYFFPRTGKTNRDGSPERLTLPTYAKDIAAFFNNPLQTVNNKLSPILSEASQVTNNKDYYGNEIRNPNDNPLQQAGQVGKYLVKENLPFSVQGSQQRVGGGKLATAESFAGINPAPGYITKSAFGKDLADTYHRLNGKVLTPEEQAAQTTQSKTYNDTLNQFYFNSIFGSNKPEASRIIDKYGTKGLQEVGVDPNKLKQQAAYEIVKSPTATDRTKFYSQQIINKLGGGDVNQLYQQYKVATAAKAKATRAANKAKK